METPENIHQTQIPWIIDLFSQTLELLATFMICAGKEVCAIIFLSKQATIILETMKIIR